MTSISWTFNGSGDWSLGSNWSGGAEPGASDDVLLNGTNAYTVTLDVADTINALALSDASAALVLDQALAVKTTLTVSAGSVQIEGGGGLTGGTLAIGSAGSAVLNGGSLSSLTVLGTLVVTDSGGVLTGDIDFAGASGTGTGTIYDNYGDYYAANYVYTQGNTTLNGATMNIGNTGIGGSVNILFAQDTTQTGATLTLGADFTLNVLAGNSALQGTDGKHDEIVNDGTIAAITAAGQLQIDATSFVNDGTIDTANGGVVFFTGTMKAALLDSVIIGTGGYAGIDGTVTGGTLVTPDGQIGSYGGSGELDGVSVQGTLTLQDGGFTLAGKNIFAGTGGTGTGTLNFDEGISYANAYLTTLGSIELNNLVLNIGDTGLGGSTNILFSDDASGTGAMLILGSAFTLNAVAGNSAIQSTDATGDEILNEGTIDATTSGGNLQIDGTKFTNKGVIDTANGGVVYFTGSFAAPLIDSVTIGTGGYAGIDGTVTGGTIVSPNGQIGSFGGSGVLDGVAVDGTLTVQDGGFTIEGKNSFAGIGGSGSGTLNFDEGIAYANPELIALGDVGLNNVVLNIGDTGLGGATNILLCKDASSTGATLLLGSAFTLNAVAGNSAIQSTDASGDVVINEGTIDATANGGYLQIDATKFTNKGVIDTANGGVVYFTGTFAAPLLDSVVEGTGGYAGIDGTVAGGTIVTPDGRIGSFGNGGVLDGVSVDGTLTVEDGAFTLAGKNSFAGIGGTGDATLDFDQGNYYANNYLTALGNVGLNDLVLNIGNTGLGGSTNILFNKDATAAGAVLVLGSAFTLNAVAGNSEISGTDGAHDAIINEGAINATTKGGVLQIDATKFTNQGVITTADGGAIYVTGPTAAALIDSIKVGVGGFVGIEGTVTNGTLVCGSTGVGVVGSSGGLSNVTVQGTLDIKSAAFSIAGNTVFEGTGGTGTGSIDFDYGSVEQADYLYLDGKASLNNVVINIGNTGEGATNILYNDDLAGTGAILTLGAGFTMNLIAGSGGIGGSANADDGVVNNGVINAKAAGVLQIAPEKFTNNGTLDVAGRGTLTMSTDFTNIAGGKLAGGTLIVGAGGTLDLANNSNVATLAANLTLSGTDSILQWLNTTTNAQTRFDTSFTTLDAGATLSLLAGRGFSTTHAIADNGTLVLGGGKLSSGGLSVGASSSLSGSGTIAGPLALAHAGTLSASGGTLSIDSGITGSGALLVGADAALLVTGTAAAQNAAVSAGGTLGFSFSLDLAGGIALAGAGDALAFGSASSVDATISGFGTGDTIDITNQALTQVIWTQSSTSAGSLQLIGASGSLGFLSLAGSYTQANFEIASDAHHIDFVTSSALPATAHHPDTTASLAALHTPPQSATDLFPVHIGT